MIYFSITKDNIDPVYDPASKFELGPMPWEIFNNIVDEKIGDELAAA